MKALLNALKDFIADPLYTPKYKGGGCSSFLKKSSNCRRSSLHDLFSAWRLCAQPAASCRFIKLPRKKYIVVAPYLATVSGTLLAFFRPFSELRNYYCYAMTAAVENRDSRRYRRLVWFRSKAPALTGGRPRIRIKQFSKAPTKRAAATTSRRCRLTSLLCTGPHCMQVHSAAAF